LRIDPCNCGAGHGARFRHGRGGRARCHGSRQRRDLPGGENGHHDSAGVCALELSHRHATPRGGDARGDPGDLPAIPRRGCGRRHPPRGSLDRRHQLLQRGRCAVLWPRGQQRRLRGVELQRSLVLRRHQWLLRSRGGTRRRLPGQQHPQRWRTRAPRLQHDRPGPQLHDTEPRARADLLYRQRRDHVLDFQEFIAPSGATRLFLGIPDGFGFDGVPGAYDDNDGAYRVRIGVNEVPAVPEPGVLALLGLGLVGLAAARVRTPQGARLAG
jgi:hypothetical protein